MVMVVEASTLPIAAMSTGTFFCATLAVTTGTGPPSPPPRRGAAAEFRLHADTSPSPTTARPDRTTELFTTRTLQDSNTTGSIIYRVTTPGCAAKFLCDRGRLAPRL